MSLAREVFWKLHGGLAKQGPGSEASTLRALALCGALPPAPRILELGCGTGRATHTLARATGGTVTAVDTFAPSLATLRANAREAGLGARIETLAQSMGELDLGAREFDLVWCESAVYTIGFDAALAAWRPLLAPGGRLALSELTWLSDRAPERVRKFWGEGYPAMRAHEANLRAIEAHAYQVLGSFTLPDADWEDGYYAELSRRIPALRGEYAHPEARTVLDAAAEEIAVFRERAGSFGYVFYAFATARESAISTKIAPRVGSPAGPRSAIHRLSWTVRQLFPHVGAPPQARASSHFPRRSHHNISAALIAP
jgi:SAM-dependent methyltransferase